MDSDAEDTKSQVENAEHPKGLEPLAKKAKKKQKKERLPVQAKVQILHDHPDKIPPIVGYFPSGFDPQKALDNDSESGLGSPNIKVYRNKKMPKRLQLVVSPNGSSVDFVGTNYSGEATAGQKCMYALGVFDKETHALKVVPIAANKIFRLDPRVRGLEYSDKETESSTAVELTAKERADRARYTTILWGSKSSIKMAKKIHALRQEGDPLSQKELDVKLKNIVVNKEALESTEAHVSRNIPPYDASATAPEQAYPLEKIIPNVEWDYLEDIYYLLQQNEADFKGYPTFICNRIDELKKIQDESEKRKVCRIFSYINHLIKFKEQQAVNCSASTRAHKIPSIVHHKFSSMFTVPESKWLPSEKINLLISYVLVLTLFSDQFRTNYTDIAKDLKMSSVPVRQRYENLGCKIIRENKLFYATLPVPLQFPELRQRYKRKRT
ncbi:DNA-directed RNA polymerase I subunit rpa49-like [Prosopis cineraria]|uniref:DNA-directed RNA polymerase I subunit rpa49-like n=1 Tax=Prosopis cineraria TaxID=364024 RepID=UPI00240F581A|nr:DNA-directed RNA polymerase I subunit rpa49-like [Prosopis cineraria]XP_054783703.1 DNA-directed RNA polymerase I subunit rpa49-like [Prosopis cineraria]XP_054783704.1 DNA-directed RNA polymerase I subunit rpa49-like [Prosopis cineraria]XP_054793518.1 DNA-directed RNA polymerase I subunit rpa49-like [Prosopis cineraria]XP_054793519.1 DNA-directed RNA polymerase I subunit rpa49-like [Prosopis cineraria]XP_054793520.1 DNA-directed RNA polymerase I subunit rpa49-like [Prosopis cineraria]